MPCVKDRLLRGSVQGRALGAALGGGCLPLRRAPRSGRSPAPLVITWSPYQKRSVTLHALEVHEQPPLSIRNRTPAGREGGQGP